MIADSLLCTSHVLIADNLRDTLLWKKAFPEKHLNRTDLAHEVVGEVGRKHFRHELRPQVVGVGGHGGHHSGGDAKAVVHGGGCVEQGLLVLLQVLVIRSR